MPSRRLQDMSSRHLEYMSSRLLQDISSRRLHRNNFSSSKTSSKRLARCLQDVFKTTSRRLGRRKIVTLKTCWSCLEDVFKINKCLLGCKNAQFVSTNCVFQQNPHIRKLGETTLFYAVVVDGLWTVLFKFWSSFNVPRTDGYCKPCQTSKMEHFAKVVNGFKGTLADI